MRSAGDRVGRSTRQQAPAADAEDAAGVEHGVAALLDRGIDGGVRHGEEADGVEIEQRRDGAGEDEAGAPVGHGHGEAVEPQIGLAERLQQAQREDGAGDGVAEGGDADEAVGGTPGAEAGGGEADADGDEGAAAASTMVVAPALRARSSALGLRLRRARHEQFATGDAEAEDEQQRAEGNREAAGAPTRRSRGGATRLSRWSM